MVEVVVDDVSFVAGAPTAVVEDDSGSTSMEVTLGSELVSSPVEDGADEAVVEDDDEVVEEVVEVDVEPVAVVDDSVPDGAAASLCSRMPWPASSPRSVSNPKPSPSTNTHSRPAPIEMGSFAGRGNDTPSSQKRRVDRGCSLLRSGPRPPRRWVRSPGRGNDVAPARGLVTFAAVTDADGTADSSDVSRAARGSAINIAGAVIQTLVGFAVVFLVTNAYGVSGAGLFFTAAALFTLAGNGARLGTESALTYFISRLRASDGQAQIRAMVIKALLPVGLISAALGIIAALVAGPIAGLLSDDPAELDELVPMIRILGLALPSWSLTSAMSGAARGFSTMRPAVFAGQIVRPLGQLGLVALVAFATDVIWPLALAWAAAAILAVVPLGVWLTRRIGRIPRPVEPFAGDFWGYARPRAGADLVNATLERLDLLLVSALVGSAGAGLYSAANRLILAGQMVMVATSQAMAPQLSANFARDDRSSAQSLLQTLVGWQMLLLWPVFVGLVFLADEVLPLFGQDFIDARWLVIILALSLMAVVGIGVGDLVLLMTGSSFSSLVNNSIALVVMVAVSLVLLPEVGVVGAAWAWGSSRICLRSLSTWQVWHRTGVHPFGSQVALSAAVALAAWIPAGLVSTLVENDLLSVLTMAVVGLVAQGTLCAVLRRPLGIDGIVGLLRRSGS